MDKNVLELLSRLMQNGKETSPEYEKQWASVCASYPQNENFSSQKQQNNDFLPLLLSILGGKNDSPLATLFQTKKKDTKENQSYSSSPDEDILL